MTRRFEMAEGGSSKFWEVTVEGAAITVCFGKSGTPGQSKPKTLASAAAAQKEADKLVFEKTKKGYREIGASTAAESEEADVPAELALLRKAKRGFFEDPAFGELTFLSDADMPRVLAQFGDGVGYKQAWWIAQEADGAILGYLRVEGLRASESPVVMVDNEGEFALAGATLVDYFGSSTLAAYEDDAQLEPLRKFCEKNALPSWRSPEVVKDMAKKLGLQHVDLDKPIALDVGTWRAQVEATRPGAPIKPKKAKAVPNRGATLRPMSARAPYAAYGDDGAPLMQSSPKENASDLLRWNGAAFESIASLPERTLAWGHHHGAPLAVTVSDVRIYKDRTWTVVPFDGKLGGAMAISSHPRSATYLVDGAGELYTFDGAAFTKVVRFTPRTKAVLLRDATGALYVIGGYDAANKPITESFVVDANVAKKIPAYPADDEWEVPGAGVVVGGTLVILGPYGQLRVFDLATRAWIPNAHKFHAVQQMIALGGRDVCMLRPGDTRVYVVNVDTGAIAAKGKLTTRPTHESRMIFDGKQLIVAGGALVMHAFSGPNAEPQLFDLKKGKASALPGCEAELAAQVQPQIKKWTFPRAREIVPGFD